MKYIAFAVNGGEVYISTRRAARNMAYQEFTKNFGVVDVLVELTGKVIIASTSFIVGASVNRSVMQKKDPVIFRLYGL